MIPTYSFGISNLIFMLIFAVSPGSMLTSSGECKSYPAAPSDCRVGMGISVFSLLIFTVISSSIWVTVFNIGLLSGSSDFGFGLLWSNDSHDSFILTLDTCGQ